MRGLDIRVAWALSQIEAITNPEVGDEMEMNALVGAEEEGYSDYRRDRFDVPLMFADVPALAQCWTTGHRLAAEMDEMAQCPGCNDDTGNPCCTHG